jgi:hypothetical protein
MNNYTKVVEAQAIATDSAGLATERYDIYMQGLEATTNKFTATWEKLWIDTIDSDLIKGVINLGTSLLTVVDAVGLLNIVIVVASGLLGKTFAASIFGLTGQVTMLGTSLGMTAVAATTLGTVLSGALIGVALVAAVAAFDALNVTMQETYEMFSKIRQKSEENISELSSLRGEYELLAYKAEKTEEDLIRLSDIQTILSVKYGIGAEGVNLYTDAINENSAAIEKNLEIIKDREELEAKEFVERGGDAYKKSKDFLEQPRRVGPGYEEATPEEELRDLKMLILLEGDVLGVRSMRVAELEKEISAAKQIIIDMEHYRAVLAKAQSERAKANTDDGERLGDMYAMEEEAKALKMLTDAEIASIDGLYSSLSSLGSEMQSLIDAQNEYGELTLDQVNKLKEMVGEDYYKALIVEGDQIKLNTEELRKMVLAKIEAAIETVKLALATDQSNESLKTQLSILQAYYNQVKSGVSLTAKSTKEQEEAYKDLLDITIKMIKDRVNAEIDALRAELAAYKRNIDERKEAIQDAADAELDALEDQLEGYERIIDAQKRLIEQKREEEKFNDAVADKNKEISDIDAELLALQFDNSEEANARRLELEEERANLVGELDDMQADHSVDSQVEALDQELEAYQRYIEDQQEAIQANLDYQIDMLDQEYRAFEDSIQAKIDQLQLYLSSSGLITQEAMDLLASRTEQFYKDLLEWNKRFGTSVDRDITDKLATAFGYLSMLNTLAGTVASQSGASSGGAGGGGGVVVEEEYHTGGIVGQAKNAEGEHYAKLLEGEVVLTPQDVSQFMRGTLPGLMSAGGGGFSIGDIQMSISVEGNLDKTVIPDLKETIFETLNEVIKARGVRRNAFSYSV